MCDNLDKLSQTKLLKVLIDGDLDSLHTLGTCPKVHNVYLDLTHKVKNIKNNCPKHVPKFSTEIHEIVWHYFRNLIFAAGNRLITPSEEDAKDVLSNGLINHISNCHDKFWSEACIHANTCNDELECFGPCIEYFIDKQCKELKEGIKIIFPTRPGQSLVTTVRTCENESFNNFKTLFLPKLFCSQDSFSIRCYLCLLEINEGFTSEFETIINLLTLPCLTSSGKTNVAERENVLHDKRMNNKEKIAKKNKASDDKL